MFERNPSGTAALVPSSAKGVFPAQQQELPSGKPVC